jgi:hypothetical protein
MPLFFLVRQSQNLSTNHPPAYAPNILPIKPGMLMRPLIWGCQLYGGACSTKELRMLTATTHARLTAYPRKANMTAGYTIIGKGRINILNRFVSEGTPDQRLSCCANDLFGTTLELVSRRGTLSFPHQHPLRTMILWPDQKSLHLDSWEHPC